MFSRYLFFIALETCRPILAKRIATDTMKGPSVKGLFADVKLDLVAMGVSGIDSLPVPIPLMGVSMI